jgi:hypothetical protein
MVSEQGDQERRGLAASCPRAGVAGNRSAAGVLAEWGRRVPFPVSAVLVLVGLRVRLRIEESPLFRRARAFARAPIAEVEKGCPRELRIVLGPRPGTDVACCPFALLLVTDVTERVDCALSVPAAVGGLVTHAAMSGPQSAFISERFGSSGASPGYGHPRGKIAT